VNLSRPLSALASAKRDCVPRFHIPSEAKLGPFAVAGEHLAAVRFSNGQPVTFDDHARDVRGVAVKFFTDEDTETDLLLTNEGGRSHARDAKEFGEIAGIVVDAIANGAVRGLGDLTTDLLERKLTVSEAIRVFEILVKEIALHKVESLVTERYWGSVVKLGQSAVKYSLQPHPSTIAGTDGDRNGPEFSARIFSIGSRKGRFVL
jgi:catalase